MELLLEVGKALKDEIERHRATRRTLLAEVEGRVQAEDRCWNLSVRAAKRERSLSEAKSAMEAWKAQAIELRYQLQQSSLQKVK